MNRRNMLGIACVAALAVGLSAGNAQAQAPGGVTNLVLWLDASQLGLSDDDPVTTWTDMSGLGNNATAAGTPIYKTGVLNGQPVIRFDDASSFTTADLSAQFPTAATVFIVTTIDNDDAYTLVKANPEVDEWWRWDGDGQSYPGVFRSSRLEGYCPMPNSGSHVFAVSSSTSAWEMSIDGASQGVEDGNYNAGGALVIGNGSTGGGLNGDIAEVIIYDRVLTAAEAEQVGSYLATKYGLATSYGPPTVVTYTPPDGGTTSATADLVLTFNEPIAIGTGNITIRNTDLSPDPDVVIDITDATQVSVSGAVLTINPTSDLVIGKNYAVQIDAGAIKDLVDVPFAGILDDTTWNFAAAAAIATTTVVVSSGSPTTYGENVTFTATVSPRPSGGTVQFKNGVDALGAPVAVNITTGEATYATTTLGAGANEITAAYSGNYQFAGSTSAPISQQVDKAPLTVKALNTLRAPNTINPDPFPYQITGYQNGEILATSGVTGTPALTTDATLESPVGDYVITCALGDLAASNYSFTLLNGTLTVKEMADTFSLNFYVGPDWPFGGLTTDEEKANVLVPAGVPAGLGDWYTSGWTNVLVPWDPGAPLAPVPLTSTKGNTATFTFKDCRNGWTYNGPRTTLLGDGNGNMMDAHVNSTLDGPYLFDMEVTDIPFAVYDVIFYIGATLAQFGDGTGVIVFNGGAERAFTLKPGAFDGTFTEMVDATTQGNYIVFTGVTGASFTTKTWGTGPTGFNHVGPFGFQIREVVLPPIPPSGTVLIIQ